MKKLIYSSLFLLVLSLGQAQTKFVNNFQLNSVEKIDFRFKFPELVQLETWDKNEIQITASVLINDGEDDVKFKIFDEVRNGVLYIHSQLDDLDGLKRSIRVRDGDDRVVRMKDNGSTIIIGDKKSDKYYNGVEVEIELIIKVPKNLPVEIDAEFGIVEVLSSPDNLEVNAEFGGIDLTVDEASIKELSTSTSWGQIYSDLTSNLRMHGNDMPGKEFYAELKSGRGNKSIRAFTSFGNVYLRKN